MKLLVTGANGFLGRFVVAEALQRGHRVRAMVRGGSEKFADHPQLEFVRADLRSRRGLVEALVGVDAVLHLAAAKTGDMYAQYAGTVVASENLLWAMKEAHVHRIVSVSSFSVYDYLKMRSFCVLHENSPLETNAFARDDYAHTKLVQERVIREHAAVHQLDFTILRPGVIYGPDNLWTARLGMQVNERLWIRIGAWARLPLTYVENCAEAIVLAAEVDAAKGQAFNVVDDNPPTQRAYLSMLRKRFSPRPQIVPVSWTLMRFLAGMAQVTNKLLFQNRAKVPGMFVPARLHARCKPLRYTNRKIKEVLGWRPRYTLNEALDRSFPKREAEGAGAVSTAPSAHADGATQSLQSASVKGAA